MQTSICFQQLKFLPGSLTERSLSCVITGGESLDGVFYLWHLPPFYMSVCLSLFEADCLPVSLFLSTAVSLFIPVVKVCLRFHFLNACLLLFPTICLSFDMSACINISLSLYMHVCLYEYLST